MSTRLRTFAALPAALLLTGALLTACNDPAEPATEPSETMMEDETMEDETMEEDAMEEDAMDEEDDAMEEDAMEDEG